MKSERPIEGPISPRKAERVYLKSGEAVTLNNPRIGHFLDGHAITGAVIDHDRVTTTTRMLMMADVERRVAVGWDHLNVCYVEMPDEPLPSTMR